MSTSPQNDIVMMSPETTASMISGEHGRNRSTSVSMDDPNVRMAAEALSGLGNPDFARASRGQAVHVSSHASPTGTARAAEPEPLLELVSQVHPWVGGTIKGSLAAYSTTKNYSPRIVRYGVNLVERNVGSPIVHVVGSVSTMTGVEAGIRRHLDARRAPDLEAGGEKSNSAMDVDGQETINFRVARPDGMMEPLPPYPKSRPPSYREEASPASRERLERPSASRSWSSQLFVSTSGLSVALSTTSRRSLRFCLQLLAHQIGNVNSLTRALSMALNSYEETRQRYHRSTDSSSLEKGGRPRTPDQDEHARQLANEIRQHCENIWQAIRQSVNVVSNYAGGALPQNARDFVRTQLLSLPQRWRVVSEAQTTVESETSRTAHRMIDFAGQGLDMLTEVSGVLQATLESAEKWLASVGRSDNEDQAMEDANGPMQLPQYATEKS